MEEITIDVLLEFLYNRFAVTFLLCLIGSCIREGLKTLPSKKDDIRGKMLNTKRIITSTVFSTFLMCACADYIELQFSIYAIISVVCGMWGVIIVNIFMNGAFITKLLKNMCKNITAPLVKNAIEVTSECIEEQEKEDKKNNEQK